MGKIFNNILVIFYIISLSTYPLDGIRLYVAGLYLPYPSIIFFLMLVAFPFLLMDKKCRLTLKRINDQSIVLGTLFFLMLVVTYLNVGASLDNYKGLFYLILPIILFVYFEEIKPKDIAVLFIIACFIAVVVGYLRYITGDSGLPSEHQLGYWGIRYTQATRNSDALYPMFLLLVSVALLRDSTQRFARIVLIVIIALALIGVTLTYSRGAWIAIFFALAILMGDGRAPKVAIRSLLFISALFILYLLYDALGQSNSEIEALLDRFATIFSLDTHTQASNAGRMALIAQSIDGITHHPFGVGAGNFRAGLGRTAIAGNAENAYLNIALEGGVLGLSLFLTMLYKMTKSTKIFLRNQRKHGIDINVGPKLGLAMIVALGIYFLFNYEANSIFVWSILAIILRFGYPQAIDRKERTHGV